MAIGADFDVVSAGAGIVPVRDKGRVSLVRDIQHINALAVNCRSVECVVANIDVVVVVGVVLSDARTGICRIRDVPDFESADTVIADDVEVVAFHPAVVRSRIDWCDGADLNRVGDIGEVKNLDWLIFLYDERPMTVDLDFLGIAVREQ